MAAPAPTAALPLARLLGHAADALAAVRGGRSLNDALARCPAPARPGTQAISFHALRWLGAAEVVRRRLAPKTPPPEVDALLLVALALLWPPGGPPYLEHVLVDQAVAATRRRAAQGAGFVNAVLRRFVRERDAIVAAALADPLARYNHPAWWLERLRTDWPDRWQDDRRRRQHASADDLARQRSAHDPGGLPRDAVGTWDRRDAARGCRRSRSRARCR